MILATPSRAKLQEYYVIIKVEDPWLKGMPCAQIALFDEINSSGSVLTDFPPEKICRFMEKFAAITVLTGTAHPQFWNFRFKVPSDHYTAMLIVTDELGFKAWQDFTTFQFKAHKRGAAVGFQRHSDG